MSGTVVNSVTGEPVSRALVEISPTHRALTDGNGRFELHNLPAMQTMLVARKPGYFNESDVDQGMGPPIVTDIGENTPPVVIKLIPEGVIFGRVESAGEPVEGIVIQLVAARIVEGRKRWEQRGTATTDDAGEFRLANLLPGTYYLATGPAANPAQLATESAVGYQQIFYPGAADLGGAAPLLVSAGQQVQADLDIRPVPVVEVAGTVAGFSGPAGASLQFVTKSGAVVAFPVNLNVATGQFKAKAPLGSYILQARSQTEQNLSLGADVPIDVAANITGLQIVLAPLPVIYVDPQYEPVAPVQTSTSARFIGHGHGIPSPLGIRLVSVGPTLGGSEFYANSEQSGNDSRLIVRYTEAGKYLVIAQPSGSWYVASMRCGDVDLMRDPLEISTGATVPPIEVKLRDDGGSIGTTITANGEPAGGWVLLVPAQSPGSAKVRLLSAREESEFQNLAPGEYSVLAFDRAEDLEYQNPEALSPYMAQAAHITLEPEQQVNVKVELIHVSK